MLYVIAIFMGLLTIVVLVDKWRWFSPVALVYFFILSIVLGILEDSNWSLIVVIRYYVYLFGSSLAILMPFFLLFLAYLMLSRIDHDRQISPLRILFNIIISLTFIGIVIYTAWVVIEKNAYLTRFLSVYTLTSIYLIVNFLLFVLINLSLCCYRPLYKDYEAIIILGARLTADGKISKVLRKRLELGAKVYAQADKKPIIIVTGGQSQSDFPSEAEMMADYLYGKGVSREDIIQENQAHSTRENLKFVSVMLKSNEKITNSLIITSHFHLLRTYFYAWMMDFQLNIIGVAGSVSQVIFATLREFIAFFVLTKELNYLFIIGFLVRGILQILDIYQ